MQFRLHINNTNNGTAIATALARLAAAVNGNMLADGFRRDLDPLAGYATMIIKPDEPEQKSGPSDEAHWRSVVVSDEQHLLAIMIAMAKKETVILAGATKADQVGQPSGIPVKIDHHDDGGFVVWLHNGQSAYYNI